jgi:hypothetical protein
MISICPSFTPRIHQLKPTESPHDSAPSNAFSSSSFLWMVSVTKSTRAIGLWWMHSESQARWRRYHSVWRRRIRLIKEITLYHRNKAIHSYWRLEEVASSRSPGLGFVWNVSQSLPPPTNLTITTTQIRINHWEGASVMFACPWLGLR